MSSRYSSSSNGFLVVHRDRPPHERFRRAEPQEFSSCTETRSSNQFGGQLTIKREESSDSFARLTENSVVAQGARYANCHTRPSPISSPPTSSQGSSAHNTDVSRATWSQINSSTEGSFNLYNRSQSHRKEPVEPASDGKERMEAASPGVEPCSSSSGNASFGVLAANLPCNRECKPTPEYLEEDNDGVRDIHVTMEKLITDASSNEIRRLARRLQPSWSDTSVVSFVSSDSESITLSREFDNVLTAARIDSDSNRPTENSSVRTPAMRSTSHLPDIGEEEPTRSTSEEAGPDRNEGDMSSGNSNLRDSVALVPTCTSVAEGQNRYEISAGRGYLALVPIDGSAGRTGRTSDRDAPPSSWDVQDNERDAIVESGNRNGESRERESFSSARSNDNSLSTPKQLALQKVKREEIEAKAVAWEEAKMAKVDNRFKRDEAITDAWENEKTVKASIKMKKVETKLEEKRATAFEKMQNEIAKYHRKAENRRAAAAARRDAAKANITEVSDKIRSAGRLPRKFRLC
eukprot:PITA_28902